MGTGSPNGASDAWWAREAPALEAELASPAAGLTSGEAAARLARDGPNEVADSRADQPWRLLLRQLQSPLVVILLIGAGISLFVAEWVDALTILAIVVGSAALGFVQEHRASRAVARLKNRLALNARVWRDGELRTLPARQLVAGDRVELAAGNLVPADGVLLAARDFLVNQASLTGESFPVEKRPGVSAADAPLGERTHCAFLGSSVRSGTATLLVVRTGPRTVMAEVAARLATRAPETEFARGVRQFGELLLRVMFLVVVVVLVANQWLGRPMVESLLFAVALAVGLSPELLPAIVGVALARGAQRLARGGVLVRRMEAIEDLGGIDVLCTDKTGTLTQGVMALQGALDAQGAASPRVMRLAYLNAAFETGIDNPIDAAIVSAGRAAGLDTAGWRKIDEIPYDFERRRLTIAVTREPGAGGVTEVDVGAGEHLLVLKGAFAQVLAACTRSRNEGPLPSSSTPSGGLNRDEEQSTADCSSPGEGQLAYPPVGGAGPGPALGAPSAGQPLDTAERDRLAAFAQQQGEQGTRVLALATRRVVASPPYTADDERELTFEGFLCFVDPPKADALQVVHELAARGVRIKVVTGDNRHVAAHLGAAVGLDPQALLTGEQIAGLREEALWHLAERTDLFVEVDPSQKERIVRALQHRGHAVGFLGDGINDAPALHAADVGVSVDSAVDVARESADIVLLRPDLEVLRRGVEEGRRTFANTLKYIQITTSANFGNMISMALATPLLPFLPLTATQILLNNFLSDLPSIAISTDRVDRAQIARPQRWHIGEVRRFMVAFGLVSSAFDLLTFWLLLRVFSAGEAVFRSGWFVVSLLTELAVVLVLRTHLRAWQSRPSGLLLWTTLAVSAVAVALPFVPGLAPLLGMAPIPAPLLAALIAVVAVYVFVTEGVKQRFMPAAGHGAAGPRRRHR